MSSTPEPDTLNHSAIVGEAWRVRGARGKADKYQTVTSWRTKWYNETGRAGASFSYLLLRLWHYVKTVISHCGDVIDFRLKFLYLKCKVKHTTATLQIYNVFSLFELIILVLWSIDHRLNYFTLSAQNSWQSLWLAGEESRISQTKPEQKGE